MNVKLQMTFTSENIKLVYRLHENVWPLTFSEGEVTEVSLDQTEQEKGCRGKQVTKDSNKGVSLDMNSWEVTVLHAGTDREQALSCAHFTHCSSSNTVQDVQELKLHWLSHNTLGKWTVLWNFPDQSLSRQKCIKNQRKQSTWLTELEVFIYTVYWKF